MGRVVLLQPPGEEAYPKQFGIYMVVHKTWKEKKWRLEIMELQSASYLQIASEVNAIKFLLEF